MFEKSIVTLIFKLWMKNHFLCLNSPPSLDINVWHYTMFFFHFAFMFKLHVFMSRHNIIHYIQWMVFKMEVYILTRLLMTIFIIHISISSWFVYLLTISLYHQHYSGLFYIWDDWQLWHSVIIFFSFPFCDIKSWVISLPRQKYDTISCIQCYLDREIYRYLFRYFSSPSELVFHIILPLCHLSLSLGPKDYLWISYYCSLKHSKELFYWFTCVSITLNARS